MGMRKFAVLIAAGVFSLNAQALSPKQYCELLEQRQAKSYELLNMVPLGSDGDLLIKACKGGQFCIVQVSRAKSSEPGYNINYNTFNCATALIEVDGVSKSAVSGSESSICTGVSIGSVCN